MKATRSFSPTSKVHVVREPASAPVLSAGYLVLHCTGRAMRGMVQAADSATVTCQACAARAAREGGVPA